MSEADALALLDRFRGDGEVQPVLALARQMPRVYDLPWPTVSLQNLDSTSWSPAVSISEYDGLRNGSPVSLGPSANNNTLPVLEPRINVTPTTDLFRQRWVAHAPYVESLCGPGHNGCYAKATRPRE